MYLKKKLLIKNVWNGGSFGIVNFCIKGLIVY